MKIRIFLVLSILLMLAPVFGGSCEEDCERFGQFVEDLTDDPEAGQEAEAQCIETECN